MPLSSSLNLKYFSIEDSNEIDIYKIDWSLCFYIEDNYNVYSLSVLPGFDFINKKTLISQIELPRLNEVKLRNMPIKNTIFKLYAPLFGESIWKFVGFENVINKSYTFKHCAKFIVKKGKQEIYRIWFKKGIGMVRKEFATGRVDWLIDYNLKEE
jgi:hypothetical protein